MLLAMIDDQLALLDTQISKIDDALKSLVSEDPVLDHKIRLIASMPGIGFLTAVTLIALMPELGTLTGKQAASLLGVAPRTRDSGAFKGKRFIRGGRVAARTALYMPAMTAMRCNPLLKTFAHTLKAKGKPHKVIRVAVMRKIIVTLNAMIQKNLPWKENYLD